MNRAQLAINSVSTRQENLEQALEAYRNAGFRNVEFSLPLLKDSLSRGHTLEERGSFWPRASCGP